MIRTRDIALVTKLLERDFGELDLAEAIENPLNVILLEGESGGIFAWRGPGIFEVHLFYAVRGREALDLFKRMLAAMSSDHGAQFFWTAIPVGSRSVVMFARLGGLKSTGFVHMKNGIHEVFVSEKNPCLQV